MSKYTPYSQNHFSPQLRSGLMVNHISLNRYRVKHIILNNTQLPAVMYSSVHSQRQGQGIIVTPQNPTNITYVV